MHRTKLLMRNDFILAFLIHESNSYHANFFLFYYHRKLLHQKSTCDSKTIRKSVRLPYNKNGYYRIGIFVSAKFHKYFDNRAN